VQARLADALEPTELEIWDRYSAVNRAVRVKMAAFPIAPRLKDVEAPEENEIQIFYVLNQGKGRRFYNPPAVEVEYVEALFAKVEPTVTVTTEEMEKFYKEHADLYEITTGTGADAKKETLRLVDVKPSIEAQLRRSKARTRALEVLNELKKTYEATPAKAEEPTADAEKPDATKKTAEPKSLEALVKARTDGVVVYHKTPPLKETALLDVPGLGPAGASSGGVVQMAFNLDATQRRLSPVMTTPEGMFLMRPASPPTPESIPELDKVREQVIVEVKKQKAFEKTLEAAQAFYDEVEKAGADAFDKLVGDKKLETEDTPFFINNFYDAGRPLVIDRFCPLELGEVYGPMGSAEEGKAVVVKVVEEREADRATYLAEREEQRFSALQTKVMNFRRTFFPKAILAFVDFEDVSMEAERAAEATSQTPTRATTAAPAPAPAPAPATTAADNE